MRLFSSLALAVATVLTAALLTAMAVSAAELVYVPMGNDDKIVIIDPSSDAVVGEIEGATAVHGLAGTPDGRYIVAGSFEERDLDGNTPAKPAGMSDDEHASHHQASTADGGEAGPSISIVTVISTNDKSIVRRIDVPGAVHHVATSPDSRFALVTHPAEGTVTAIDLATFSVIATVETGMLPNYAVFEPDGSAVFVSNSGTNTVSEINTATWTVERTFLTGASPEHMVVSRDGMYLYVNNVDDGTTSAFSIESGVVETTYRVGNNLHGIDIADDGQTLFVASRDDNILIAIGIPGGAMRNVALDPEPYHLAAIHGFGKVYVSSADDPIIWVIDQETLSVIGKISIGGKGHQIVQGFGG